MNPNCKWKRDNDLSVKERKVEKRKYKGNIINYASRKKTTPRWIAHVRHAQSEQAKTI